MSDIDETDSGPEPGQPDPVEPEPPSAPQPPEPAPEPAESAETLAVRALREELAASHVRAAAREELVRRLHDDVQRLRVGERANLLRPVIVDLGRLRNALSGQAEHAADPAIGVLFAGFADDVYRTLERIGVEALRPEPGGPITIGAHRVTGVDPTHDAELDQTVAAVQAEGYRDTVADKVVAPAEVRAWRYEPAEQTTQPNPTAEEHNGQ